MGVLLGIRIGSKCNERSRWASDTRGETVDISVSEEVSEETRGGSGCRRESNGDDRGRDKDEGEEQNDQSQTMLQGIGVALSHTPSSILSLDHLRVTVFIN